MAVNRSRCLATSYPDTLAFPEVGFARVLALPAAAPAF
jgi:hypothetical protein